jgi:hypothetical protein
LGFARGGWTPAVQAFAKEIGENLPKGKNREATGTTLLDLPQVERDLAAWSV